MNWKSLKQSFFNKYLLGAYVFLVIMLIIVLIGNPEVNGFYIHFIPEMCSIYLLGFWAYYEKFSFKLVLFYYCVVVFLAPILAGSSINFMYLIVLPVSMLITSPMLFAYYLAKREALKRSELR